MKRIVIVALFVVFAYGCSKEDAYQAPPQINQDLNGAHTNSIAPDSLLEPNDGDLSR